MREPLIRSPRNPRIKAARRLNRPRARRETGRFLVEGLTHIAAALEAGGWLETLFWAPERLRSAFGQDVIDRARAAGVEVIPVTSEVLDALSPKDTSQGMVAVARQRWTRLDELSPHEHSWLVAMVAPQDPGNVGTVLRTMDAAGASAWVRLEGGTDPFHPTAVRASMGAVFWLPVVDARWSDFVVWARPRGYVLYGSSAHAAQTYRSLHYQRPRVLVLGNERTGLTPEQRAACHHVVRIPMVGRVRSLNVAVAAGLLLYAMRELEAGQEA
ncbi:MAG: RNA methyltransferase [Chloroflexi bacterium]|nr:RNA methyltransferase [Chloroflexota bacterium]